jgi:hypothetical protein
MIFIPVSFFLQRIIMDANLTLFLLPAKEDSDARLIAD